MGGTSADNNDIDWIEGDQSPIRVANRDLRPRSERFARLFGQAWINFDRHDFARRSNELGSDGGVIAGAATKMEDLLSGSDAELVQKESPKARLAVIDTPGLVERDQHIVIDVPRIGIIGGPIILDFASDFSRATAPLQQNARAGPLQRPP